MKKERIVIILIVLIIGGFFLVKSIKSDSIALSNNNILNETKKEDKINNVVQYQEDSKTNITNENIKENKEESNISKKHSVEKSYFNDALFIGDSRTVGISEYGDLNNATFFAISSKARGKGIGKKMFCNMLEYMKLQNINDFYLFTDTTCNYGFYEHQGMNRCDEKSKTFLIHGKEAKMTFFLYDYKIS